MNGPQNARARRDDETQRQQLRRSAILAALAFVGLIAIDYVIVLTLFPEVDILWCAGWRAVGAVVTFAGRPIFARRGRSGRAQTLIASILLALSVVPLGILTVGFGGLESSYVFHLAFVAVGVGSYLPAHWHRLTALLAPAVATSIATLLIALERTHHPDLDGLVMDCLAQDPATRPKDGAELLARLDALHLEPWTQAEAAAWWEAARVHAAQVLAGDHAPRGPA